MAADWGQNDEVVSKPTQSWGEGDEVVSAKKSSGGIDSGDVKVAGQAFARGLPGTAGFLATAGATSAVLAGPALPAVAAISAATGPAAPLVAGAIEMGGPIVMGMLGAFGVTSAVDKLNSIVDPKGYAQWQKDKAAHPDAELVGTFASGFAGSSWRTAAQVPGKIMSNPLVQRATGAGMMGGLDAVQQYAQTGTIDPKAVAASTAGGFILPGLNPAGKLAHGAGELAANVVARTGKPVKPKLDTTLEDEPTKPKTDNPKEREEYLDRLKKAIAERDKKVPLVETAIRNKETGEIERMGPKHDEARKEETKDTHEQGFIDERGKFLNRKEAWNRAIDSGMIPEDHTASVPGEGLHSGDLRQYGHEKFQVKEPEFPPIDKPAEEKPPTETKASEPPPEPKTREEHKEAIKQARYRLRDIEVEKAWAEDQKDEKGLEALKQEEKGLNEKVFKYEQEIPPVEFKDPKNPTSDELRDHLYGINNLGDAFDHILTTGIGTGGQRVLIEALRRSKFVNKAKLYTKEHDIEYQREDGSVSKAAGLYHHDSHSIGLGKQGDLRTLLHESIHAGTAIVLHSGGPAAARMEKLFENAKASFMAREGANIERRVQENVKYKGVAGDEATKLADEVRNQLIPYGFTNSKEFVAEAFTNKRFAKELAGAMIGGQPGQQPKTVWTMFKDLVRLSLDIPDSARTVFDEVIDEGIKIIEHTEKTLDVDNRGPVYKTGANSPAEAPKAEEKIPNVRDIATGKEFHEKAMDVLEKHGEDAAYKFYQDYQEYKNTWSEPVKEIEKFVGINIKNKLAQDRMIHLAYKEMMEQIPHADRREAIALAVDSGDMSGLAPAEEALAQKFNERMKEIGDRAVKEGVVRGLIENYVSHIVEWQGAPKGAKEEFIGELLGTAHRDPNMRGMSPTAKFAKERTFKTFSDLEAYLEKANERIARSGSDFRLQIKTKDIAEIYKEYATAMEKAIENKKLIDSIQQIRNVVGKTMIQDITKEQPLPHGWEAGQGQLAGKAIHPDMMPALKFVFDAGPSDLMKALGAISQLTKRMNVIGSFFHAKSLMEVMSSSGIPIWTPLKEVGLGAVDKAFGTKFSGLTKALEQFRNGGVGDSVDRWIKEGGLVLETPEDVSKGVLSSTGKFADRMIGKYGPKTRILEKSLSKVEKSTLGLFDKFTWDYLNTGGKIMVAERYLDRARQDAAKAGKEFDETASRKEISRFINDSFGGLNYFDVATSTENEFAKRLAMAAFNPEGRRNLQLALFAPDWTISTIRAFTAALPKELNPMKWHPIEGVKGMATPTGRSDYARLYQFKTALTYFTLLNMINLATADRNIWENKDPSRIEFKDGTSMQAMKHAMEPYHWIADPDKTISNKLGFIPKAMILGIAGTEYAGPYAQKLVDPSGPERLKNIAKTALPFQFQAESNAPPGEGLKRAALGTMGFPVYGSTPEQKKADRAERTKKQKENQKKWREEAKRKGWE